VGAEAASSDRHREEARSLRDAIAEHRATFLGQDTTGSCYDCCMGCPLEEDDANEWDRTLWSVLGGDA
jgi:hypothetical protein